MRSTRNIIAALAAMGMGAAGLATVPTVAQADPPRSSHHGKCHRNNNSVHKLLECVTLKGVMEHQRAFQRIANRNDGTRASGTPGYDASADYVVKRLRKAGYKVRRQTVPFFSYEEVGPSVLQQLTPNAKTYVEDTDFAPTTQTEPGDVTASVTAVDLDLGIGNTSTSGCEAEDFADFPAGDIALIQRGVCTFEIKAENAAEAGAVGVIFFNQGDTADPSRQGIPAVTLGNGYTGGIPALSTTYAVGAELAALTGLTVRLFANVSRVEARTANVIAESRHGNRRNVIMAGAHLDSVPEGPGINDNGSGSSALIEIAEQMAKVKTRNRVRFAWWAAEEAGLVGSTYYVDNLSERQIANIELYLNFDMIASPNYGLFIYDGDGSGFGLVGPEGSDDIEALFERFYRKRGIPSEPTEFSGRSDYQAFINNGIPSGGLFTGAEGIKTPEQEEKWGGTAGIAYDPCYHQACDTIRNVSRRALRINSDAIAYVTFLYATGRRVINND